MLNRVSVLTGRFKQPVAQKSSNIYKTLKNKGLFDVEPWSHKPEVSGSIPLAGTISLTNNQP